jgi:hypothetical protein
MESIELPNGHKVDKITRYNWEVIDKPGRLAWINKSLLTVDTTYQRTDNITKARALARKFSWMACGAILVAKRDKTYYVFDGQHRVLAAKLRSDIIDLPCCIFDTTTVEAEASAFVNANTNRKMPTTYVKYKALLVAGDLDALYLNKLLKERGLKAASHSKHPREIKALYTCFQLLKEDRQAFEDTLDCISILYTDQPVSRDVMIGLNYMVKHLDVPLSDKRLLGRLTHLGPIGLLKACKQAQAYYQKGGAKIFAIGILEEVNRNLRNKFKFNVEERAE